MEVTSTPEPEVLWTPPPDVRLRSRMGRWLEQLERKRGLRFGTYGEVWRWSVDDLEAFWASIWDFFAVSPKVRYDRPLSERCMPGARWFPGAQLNYAEHALRLDGRSDDDVVVIGHSQTREPISVAAWQLRDQVARARAGLVRLGVRRGDRVVGYLPNIPEALVAFLATASRGAIWSSCAPELGARGVIDRFAQVEPTVLIAVEGYRYGAKEIDRAAEVDTIREALPSLRATVKVPYLDTDPASLHPGPPVSRKRSSTAMAGSSWNT